MSKNNGVEIKKLFRKQIAERKKKYGENWYEASITEKVLAKVSKDLA